MHENQISSQPWLGSVAITAGMGVFLGASGDNKPHRHWAHQIAIGLEEPIALRSDKTRYFERGLWIPAGTIHQLETAHVLCIYIDPTHDFCKTLLPQIAVEEWSISVLNEEISSAYVMRFAKAKNLQGALISFDKQCRCQFSDTPDERLNIILAALKDDISSGNNTTQKTLSSLLHLSPSRFSHWFTEQTGMPLRSYRKWLKLLVGFELSRQMPLTDAAFLSGFSDQAHFCRAVTQAFGVSATTIKQLLLQK
ncbi:AraC-like DNA-binding protein [Zhongshania antarctica]|uniref:AraC-like DNA-binding protein n=1 Tax=Zhongshania antarctica TaxID=641702 RepID=A0A840R922_9GAMM|nr:helix-turn-helix transcriptional regulator [Zhongshania antarctica]MBB5188862.1 AraC-like DNA-binding protein [Zhongshania antarctica]